VSRWFWQEPFNPDAPVQAVIQRETPIIPTVVAFAVCEEAGLCLGLPLPVEWIAELAEHAEVVYQHNPRFRQLLRRPTNAGRDWLWSFTRHWLWAILASRRPDLLSRLPPSYAIGRGPCFSATCPPRDGSGEDRLLPADGAVETMRRGGRQRVRYAQLA